MKLLGVVLVAAALLGVATGIQERLRSQKPSGWFQERMSYLPSSETIRPALLGFETTYASYLWIRTTLYLGGHYLSDKEYPWLVRLVDMVTKLNPRFYPAYEYAGTLLPDLCGDHDAPRVILHRGLANVSRDKWKLAFYLGSIHLLNLGDEAAAADYFALAAHLPGAPVETLARSAAVFYSRTGRQDRGIAFLAMMYETTEDPAVKRRLAERMREMQVGR